MKQQPSFSTRDDSGADPTSPEIDSAGAGDTIVFAGDPSQVRIGFAMALRLMGLDAPAPNIGECAPSERED